MFEGEESQLSQSSGAGSGQSRPNVLRVQWENVQPET